MSQAKLLDIAIREFGLKGIDGASTRGIAAAAGTAMSAITYHYGGKEGLYLAAADHIAGAMAEEMAAEPAAHEGVADDDAPAARAAIHAITGRMIAKMLSEASADWALFILREQANPTEAFDRIYAGMMGQMLRRLSALIAIATGVGDTDARLAAMTFLGQALAARASRAAMLRLLEIERLDDATCAAFTARIHANIDAILDRMTAEEPQ